MPDSGISESAVDVSADCITQVGGSRSLVNIRHVQGLC
jgi:hypothetical protein